MPTPYILTRGGAITDKDGSILYEARELAHLSQEQREALLQLHNEYPEMRTGEALEILVIWEREGVE